MYYTVADNIFGPYGPRKFVGRFLGHGTPFQTRDGKWWCTAFFNGDIPTISREDIETTDLSETAQSINERGTTIVPLEVKVLENGEIFIRAKDSAYAVVGPDENQDYGQVKPEPKVDTTGLIFHFGFEDNLVDSSDNGHLLTAANTPVYATGKYGSCVELNGTSDYFDMTTTNVLNTGTEPFTFAAWLNSDTEADGAYHVLHQLGGRVILHQVIDGTDSKLGTWIGGAFYSLTGDYITTNTWQHIAMTFEPLTKTHKYYVNGSYVGKTVSKNAFESKTGGFRIGAHKNGSSLWNGKLDEVYMYKVVLTEEQISALMSNQEITNLNNLEEEKGIFVYPNPANNRIHIAINEIPQQVSLLDLSGKLIQSELYTKTLNISAIEAGYYILHLTLNNGENRVTHVTID